MSKEGSQTLPGNYHVLKMPDGQLLAFSKLSDGTWVQTEERIKKDADQVAFEKRFDNTKTVPNDFVAADTDVLTPDMEKMKNNYQGSKDRLVAYLTEMLGNPDDIISGVIEVKEVKVARHKEQIVGLITVLGSPKWNKVKAIIWK